MAEKVTTMVLNVFLQYSKCYKKIKKLLCKFPDKWTEPFYCEQLIKEIRDQTYDEKTNKVTIKVVCCSLETIRDKLCCKGGGCIKSIEIKKPDEKKPPPPRKPKTQPLPQPPTQPPSQPLPTSNETRQTELEK